MITKEKVSLNGTIVSQTAQSRETFRSNRRSSTGFSQCITSRLIFLLFAWPLLAFANEYERWSLEELFFKTPLVNRAKLSPDGSHLTYTTQVEGTRVLHTYSFMDGSVKGMRGIEQEDDIYYFDWADGDTLVFSLLEIDHFFVGLWAANEDLSHNRRLFTSRFHIVDLLPWQQSEILLTQYPKDRFSGDVFRMNPWNGRKQRIVRNPGDVYSWLADQRGVVKLGLRIKKSGESEFIYRDTHDAEWRILDIDPLTVRPISFNEEGNALLTATRHQTDRWVVQGFDLLEGKFRGEPISHPICDLLIGNRYVLRKRHTGQVLGFTYHTERPKVMWFAPQSREIQKAVDTALPQTFNRILGLTASGKLLVSSTCDVQPQIFHFWNHVTERIETFTESWPWLRDFPLAPMRPIEFKSRDGVTLYGYLTLRDKKDEELLPLLVLPHGGPRARDFWGFNAEVQYFVAQGYAVLQVNYRGSSGYGKSYELDSILDVCTTSVDDIADATRWTIEQKIADPRRIGIYGASYGGYAAVATSARYPELFRCAIAYAGVFNMHRLAKDLYESAERMVLYNEGYYPDQYKEQYLEISPVNFADEVTNPVYLIYGDLDRVVNRWQTLEMSKAFKRAKVDYRLQRVLGGKHGFPNEKKRIEYYQDISNFLAENLN